MDDGAFLPKWLTAKLFSQKAPSKMFWQGSKSATEQVIITSSEAISLADVTSTPICCRF